VRGMVAVTAAPGGLARLAVQKERADVEDNFRKTVGQALCGAAVLIGAGAAEDCIRPDRRAAAGNQGASRHRWSRSWAADDQAIPRRNWTSPNGTAEPSRVRLVARHAASAGPDCPQPSLLLAGGNR
jgi:hypothetical protein